MWDSALEQWPRASNQAGCEADAGCESILATSLPVGAALGIGIGAGIGAIFVNVFQGERWQPMNGFSHGVHTLGLRLRR